MKLSTEQISFIRQDIVQRGISMEDLADSLTDHVCCSMENDTCDDFHEAYASALQLFGDSGLKTIQRETILQLILKKEINMKTKMYVFAYVASLLITTGLLFKVQHWPGAMVMLTLGIALLNFGFLPMYFYAKYKRATAGN